MAENIILTPYLSLSDTRAACRGEYRISRPAHTRLIVAMTTATRRRPALRFIGFGDRDYFKYRTKVSRFPNEAYARADKPAQYDGVLFRRTGFCTALIGSRTTTLLGTGTTARLT